jgi:hypothetical protein
MAKGKGITNLLNTRTGLNTLDALDTAIKARDINMIHRSMRCVRHRRLEADSKVRTDCVGVVGSHIENLYRLLLLDKVRLLWRWMIDVSNRKLMKWLCLVAAKADNGRDEAML